MQAWIPVVSSSLYFGKASLVFGQTVFWNYFGHNNTKHFLCPIRSRHPLEFLEIVRWESVPRGSFARTWKLSSRPFSRPDWLPLGLRGWLLFTIKLFFLLLLFVCSEVRFFAKFNTREIKWNSNVMLGVVACVLVVVCKRMQQLPTMLEPSVHRGKDTTHKSL